MHRVQSGRRRNIRCFPTTVIVFALIPTPPVCFFYLRDCWIRQPVARLPDAYDHAYVPVCPGQRRFVTIRHECLLLTVVYRHGRDPLHRLDVPCTMITIFENLPTILTHGNPTLLIL